ncbi:hypothetical protein [Okeania sp.]|uniref:hypothetical protein n=1 Tax=Okeania sp. TaxID=3100323 RepID=UPI002B4ADD4C|nr:hypothetical protein [Okeania sp.]MEB3339945.1 hypothetical protein [Okeania sp.]
MKRIIITSLIGITTLNITPLILPLLPQESYAQTSDSEAEKLEQLLKTASQQRKGIPISGVYRSISTSFSYCQKN